jgi:hypothetical protein
MHSARTRPTSILARPMEFSSSPGKLSVWLARAGVLVSALFASPLYAGPPFFTDDPGTPGPGRWEINTAWVDERRAGETASELPLLDINYGWGDRLQLKYEVSWLHVREDGTRQNGLSNSLIGVKWRFADAGKQGVDLSMYPQFEFRNPGSPSVRKGLVADESTLILPLQLEKALGPVTIVADFGRELPSKSEGGWFYGVVVSHEFTERVEAGVELHGEAAKSFDRTALIINFGATIKVGEKSALLISLGRELHNHEEPRATWVSYLGWQQLF